LGVEGTEIRTYCHIRVLRGAPKKVEDKEETGEIHTLPGKRPSEKKGKAEDTHNQKTHNQSTGIWAWEGPPPTPDRKKGIRGFLDNTPFGLNNHSL